ncbi:MAG TPA: hypothetical protein VN224_15695, partial [Xanthomonadales bacterium]|nr:hypothetical protein [Xanthomonadales bacterium]
MTANDVGAWVRLRGWVNRRRDHGGLIFIDLREPLDPRVLRRDDIIPNLVQLVVDPGVDAPDPDIEGLAPEPLELPRSGHVFADAEKLRSEAVISVVGLIQRR